VSERGHLRDALALERNDLGGYGVIADAYRLEYDQGQLLSTTVTLLALHPDADLEELALYLSAGEER
jgi:hypothetical protein